MWKKKGMDGAIQGQPQLLTATRFPSLFSGISLVHRKLSEIKKLSYCCMLLRSFTIYSQKKTCYDVMASLGDSCDPCLCSWTTWPRPGSPRQSATPLWLQGHTRASSAGWTLVVHCKYISPRV